MINYKNMYILLCGAVSDSLDILTKSTDIESIDSVCILLKQSLISAEQIYITARENKETEE